MSKTDNKTTSRTRLSPGPHKPGERAACVVVIYGEGLGQRVGIDNEAIVIGRSQDADLQLPHPSVSRRHCMIERVGRKHHILDLGATNRTRVNDSVLDDEAQVLKDGDHITIGESVLKFIGNTSLEAPYHAEIYEQVTHDALTGLYNRRHFMELLGKERARASRYRRPLSLCIIDIDRFKHINDSYGHPAGDEVLELVARIIREHARTEDVAARIGGEEFAVLFPETRVQAAVEICERLRLAVAACACRIEHQPVTVTVSLGTTQLQPGDSQSDFIRRSDKALYRAKNDGRNKTCFDP